MKFKYVLGVARNEIRVCRRLVRTHVVLLCVTVVCATVFIVVCVTHTQSGGLIPMMGILSPRYIAGTHGDDFCIVFCIVLLLFSFDHLRRDENSRIDEVIRSLPVSNLDLIVGRLIGNIVVIGVPMLCFLFLMVSYGVIAEYFSFKFGTLIEPLSVFSFIFLDAIPNFVFFGSLVVLLALVLKSRFLALLISMLVLFGFFWVCNRLPLDVSGPLQSISGSSIFPSELAPSFFTSEIVCNRIALLLFATGFLLTASAFLGRTSASKSKEVLIATVPFFAGIVLVGTLFGVQARANAQVQQWIEVHDRHFVPAAFPDIKEINGRIEIKPGQSLSLNLSLDVSVDTNQESDHILFSFNPGYDIIALTVAENEIQDYEFAHGLLQIPRRYFSSEVSRMNISADGVLDKKFAYLDSVGALSEIVGPSVTQLRLLGSKTSIFHPNFVVLAPGVKWYPTAGTATKEDDWERRQRDFFTVDLKVTVPRHWIVAGPAKRETVDESEDSTFWFKQTNPLPEIALVGSKFEQAAVEIDGTLFEILYSRVHRKTIEAFGLAKDTIKLQLERFSNELTSKGFEFPYGVISLVEVPSDFRVFGGGERMDTIMSPPGIAMVRESSLFTVPVKGLLPRSTRGEEVLDEKQLVEWLFHALIRYLQLPMDESNPTQNLYKDLVAHQTNATGQGASFLNALVEQLSLRFV